LTDEEKEETLLSPNVEICETPQIIGEKLAAEILTDIEAAQRANRPYLLGCPSGRTPQPIYAAMAQQAGASGADLSTLILVMMDEYLGAGTDGKALCPFDSHYSCRRFAEVEIRQRLNSNLAPALQMRPEQVWFPSPDRPTDYDNKIAAAGGVDFFILASGASDGHVAFNPPNSAPDGKTSIVTLAEATRRDNLGTFPDFNSLDEVPLYGLSVGLGTIAQLSKEVVMILHGSHKHTAASRLLSSHVFEPDWPATIVHLCPKARIFLDRGAAGDRQDG